MSLFVFVTEECTNQAGQHGVLQEVQRFKDRVEESESTSQFDHFPAPYLVKKKIGMYSGRLIAERRYIDDHVVIVFLAFLIRGSRDYERFTNDPHTFCTSNTFIVSDKELMDVVEQRTAVALVTARQVPSISEYSLLYAAFSHHSPRTIDDMVFETRQWVEQVSLDRISNQLNRVSAACLNALSQENGLNRGEVEGCPGWVVWSLRQSRRLLLIGIATGQNDGEMEDLAKITNDRLKSEAEDDICRESRRAYPALILADVDLWISLEKEGVANMALSPEESRVLDSVRRTGDAFPLFINGRAGSGKSTILQYLFADLLFSYLNLQEPAGVAPPIYLTANGELLRTARTFVERLLQSEANFVQEAGSSFVDANRGIISEAFKEFQVYLLSLVPHNDRATSFVRSNRVDYARFKRMWIGRFGKDPSACRDYGPDLSWHVIRGYIKGMSSETFLDPEEYLLLPENQISVACETYKMVYERVWRDWYAVECKGLWDDQDLARYLLENDLLPSIFPAVFCDEAQDFTRIELELLLRLNLFSARRLLPTDIARIGFAFAGDPFQTLNPTGFRWDAIKASFVEKFIFELDPARRAEGANLNYWELQYNYRSTEEIVKFGNHVQAMRAALFDSPDLRPQTPWVSGQRSFPVSWFRAHDANFWQKANQIPGFVVIVPCNEGEELEFVKSDPVLSAHIRIEDGVPVNVLSAARSKGCEYSAVIVYGFGSAVEIDVCARITADDRTTQRNPDALLPLQYFINRLYVAVSRAKRRLIIVDTDAGFDRLWRFARDDAADERLLLSIRNGPSVWAHEIGGMIAGDVNVLMQETAVDPLENANAFENEGLAQQDAFLLRQAAQAYRSGGNIQKSRECKAHALEIDGALLDAGNAFLDAGFVAPKAVKCFWRAGESGWKALTDCVTRFPQVSSEVYYEWASAISQHVSIKSVERVLSRFVNRLDDPNLTSECIGDPIWDEAIDALLKLALIRSESDASPLRRICLHLDAMRGKGIQLPPSATARVYFLGGQYDAAVQLWDTAGENKAPDYFRARAKVDKFPQSLIALAKIGDYEEIVRSYWQAADKSMSPEGAALVIEGLRRVDKFDEAIQLAWDHAMSLQMIEIALDRFTNGKRMPADAALYASVILLVQQKQWEPLVEFVSSLKFIPNKAWATENVASWIDEESGTLQATLVRAIARSRDIGGAKPQYVGRINDFLNKFLKVKDGQWRAKVAVEEAGAAFERVGRYVSALAFYEAIRDGRFTSSEREFARHRWLVCKNRQLDHERSRGNAMRVGEVHDELKRGMASARLNSLADLDPYPALLPLSMPSVAAVTTAAETSSGAETAEAATCPVVDQLPDKSVILVGAVRIEFSRSLARINFSNETMHQGFVKIREQVCGGEFAFKYDESSGWESEQIGVRIRLGETHSDAIKVQFVNEGVEVSLRPNPAQARTIWP
jgi:tetratricopeptide (TPR) repeat protein